VRKKIETTSKAPEPVREQIKEVMNAGGPTEDFLASVPEQVDATEDEKPRRKRRTKAEIAQAEASPLFGDERYMKAISNINSFGGKKALVAGFTLAGQPLDQDEEGEVDDLFYVIARRARFNPEASWWIIGFYSLFLLARLIVTRSKEGKRLLALLRDESSKSKESKEIQ